MLLVASLFQGSALFVFYTGADQHGVGVAWYQVGIRFKPDKVGVLSIIDAHTRFASNRLAFLIKHFDSLRVHGSGLNIASHDSINSEVVLLDLGGQVSGAVFWIHPGDLRRKNVAVGLRNQHLPPLLVHASDHVT